MKISFNTVLLVYAMVKSCQSCGSKALDHCARNSDCGEDKLCIDNTCQSQANPQMTKIFIATGWQGGFGSVGNNIEIVDLQGNGQQCTQQYPIRVSDATGGLMPGGEGIICGGLYDETDVCHLIPSMEKITMKKKRARAASLVFNGRLLVAGGSDRLGRLKSTEWVSATTPHTEEAGDLPIPLYWHSMELISIQGQPYAMAIGGSPSPEQSSSKTFLGNLNGAQIQWTEGPPLMTPRSCHASALLQHQETTYIVVAGGVNRGSQSRGAWKLDYFDSVEMWKVTSTPSEWTWTAGPRLPKPISGASMVSLGTKVILLGGSTAPGSYEKDIYELSSPNGVWEKLPQTLKKAREDFVAFPIPQNWTHC